MNEEFNSNDCNRSIPITLSSMFVFGSFQQPLCFCSTFTELGRANKKSKHHGTKSVNGMEIIYEAKIYYLLSNITGLK